MTTDTLPHSECDLDTSATWSTVAMTVRALVPWNARTLTPCQRLAHENATASVYGLNDIVTSIGRLLTYVDARELSEADIQRIGTSLVTLGELGNVLGAFHEDFESGEQAQ